MATEIRDIYVSSIGKYNFGTPSNPGVFLQGLGTSPGISVNGSFVMGSNYVNFGVSAGNSGYGFGVSPGGSIMVKNRGGDWTVITDIGNSPSGGNTQVQFNDNGTFGACAGFTFDNSTNSFVVGGNNNQIGPGQGFISENVAIAGGISNGVSGFGFYSGVFCGRQNLIEASSSAIIAGQENNISADATGPVVIVGGYQNLIGHSSHTAGGRYSVIAGGQTNKIFGQDSFIGGGQNNGVSGFYSGNIAGQNNKIDGNNSSIIAGQNNIISSNKEKSVIAGGVSNQSYSDMSFVTAGFNNSVRGVSSVVLGGFSNKVNNNNSFNVAGRVNTVNGESNGNVAGSSNEVSGIYSVNIGGISNTVNGIRVGNFAGSNNGVSGEDSANLAGNFNNVFSNDTVALGGQGLSTQTGTSWERMALVGTHNNYLTYPWDESETQPVPGTCYRFLVGSGDSATGNNAFAVDDVGNLYFGTCAGACIYQRTGPNTYQPINLGGGGGGGGGNPAGGPNDIQFQDPALFPAAFAGNSSFQIYDGSTYGVSALTVDGNVFSSMGVSDVRNQTPTNPYQITAEDFVNGFIFPPCQSSDENQLFVVQVPSYTDITTFFSIDVLKVGQTFDTVIYGTSIGSSPAIGMSFPSDITILESSDGSAIFDRRLVSDKNITGGLSFHFADASLAYYQGVVIRSKMGSAGVSMYPYATSFYTC